MRFHAPNLGPEAAARAPRRPGPLISSTRWLVLPAVGAVLLVSATLLLLGVAQTFTGIWHVFERVLHGELRSGSRLSVSLSVEFLEIVSTLFKAVVFYLIGIGLYSLFVTPLEVTRRLGIATLADLDEKIISVIVVILGVTFLEEFISNHSPAQILQRGAAMAIVIFALVVFQMVSHRRVREDREDAQAEESRPVEGA